MPTVSRTLVALMFMLYGCAHTDPSPQSRSLPQTAEHDNPETTHSPASALKIATWNLEWLNQRNGNGPTRRQDADYHRLRGYADRLNADVVAFQEVDGPEAARRVFDPAIYDLYVADQKAPQRTGFAVRKGIHVTPNPDYTALDVGGLRSGADITLELNGQRLRLLSVHLKSGCFATALTSRKKACVKLKKQIPIIERWIDDRGREGTAAAILGDFNRRFFDAPHEPFWAEIDDSDPPDSDLYSPTNGEVAQCWNGKFPDFIDHLVFNKPASAWIVKGSFDQQPYDDADARYKSKLSDHCPLSVLVTP